jgi:hypothetical protein
LRVWEVAGEDIQHRARAKEPRDLSSKQVVTSPPCKTQACPHAENSSSGQSSSSVPLSIHPYVPQRGGVQNRVRRLFGRCSGGWKIKIGFKRSRSIREGFGDSENVQRSQNRAMPPSRSWQVRGFVQRSIIGSQRFRERFGRFNKFRRSKKIRKDLEIGPCRSAEPAGVQAIDRVRKGLKQAELLNQSQQGSRIQSGSCCLSQRSRVRAAQPEPVVLQQGFRAARKPATF